MDGKKMDEKRYEGLEKFVRINISLYTIIILFKLLNVIYISVYVFTQNDIDIMSILGRTVGIDSILIIVFSIQLYKSVKLTTDSNLYKNKR